MAISNIKKKMSTDSFKAICAHERDLIDVRNYSLHTIDFI